MYLKSIELSGFKSFNERTIIKLNDGISCIVGPNGSGKSNISDAVRWVLGEQSARILRGQKMEDVIFAGTDKLKPLGMAEVVLNIDNSDGSLPVEFNEVAVCRRAYRDGESEYLLNGRQCRLTDIREMFMDSGISNNSLALIGQGRIQQVVDMKPEERRLLLEEAAGIVKYRTRKRTAERKLADTEQNLERIWDIISELSGRLEPLAEQSAKAEEYLRLKDSADKQEINLLLQNLSENREALRQNTDLMEEKQSLAAETEAEKALAESKLASSRLSYDQAEEALLQARQALFDLKSGKEQTEAQIALLQEKMNSAAENIARLEAELELLLTRDDGFVAEVNKLNEEKELAGQELRGLDSKIRTQENEFNAQRELLEELTAEQEQARQEIFDHASQLANTKNELNFLGKSLEDNLALADDMRREIADLQNENGSFDSRIAEMQTEISELVAKRENTQTALAEIGAEMQALEKNILTANEESVAIRLKLNSEESRLKVLSEMADNKSGFYPGVRSILRAAEKGNPAVSGVHGVVLDLIESEVKYSLALESAAGASLQNIVVTDDKAARDCVAYLKREQLGRATFLPLASLRWRENQEIERALGEKGVIGRCSEVIKCAEVVRPAVKFIFDNILLVEDLEDATEIARRHRQQFRIVTLAGDIISPGGSITGGSKQKNSGDLLQKKNQLAELKNDVARLKKEGAEKGALVAALEEKRAALDGRRSALSAEDRDSEILYLGKVKDVTHMRDMLAEKNTQLQKMQRDLQENGREQERMERRRAELAAEIENWGALSEQANEVLVDLQRRYEEETVRMEAARKLLEESRMFALEKRQKFTNLENEVKRLTSEKSNLFEEQANKQSAKANFAAQLAELKAAIAEKQQAAQNFVAGILTAETEIAENGNSNAAMKQEIEDLERQIAMLNRDAAVYGQELHQLEVKEARLQAENEAESGKLAETFELTYEEALPYLDDTVSRAELARSVKELRRNIVALGNVNIEAIEEYKQVRERHEFLTAQREDLLEAHESLINVIKEMDGIMTKRFRETFDLVNTNFAKTFNRLFGGGSAALLLVDPDDLLETGVDMLVQPPGKKLINYNLLSGGEKSLIGVALVLAIFQVKPSPFCILDEVDAALDEANVDRFAEYIKSFKNSTQFIVVTHRQGTMEVADRLWGVTMEKDGISKIVSVKLSDDLQQFVS